MPSNHSRGRLLVGLFLVLVGAYLLLNNFGIVPFTIPPTLFSWPSLLIIIGLILLGTNRESQTGGIIFVMIGTVFLLPRVFDVTVEDLLRFWPLIFVFIGLSIMLKQNREKKKTREISYRGTVGEAVDYVDETATFRNNRRTILSDYFKGGNISAIFSNIIVDLSEAKLAEGNYTISVFVLFGSVQVIVPQDWNATNQCDSILGDVRDTRMQNTPYASSISKQLRLTGNVIFSNCRLSNR